MSEFDHQQGTQSISLLLHTMFKAIQRCDSKGVGGLNRMCGHFGGNLLGLGGPILASGWDSGAMTSFVMDWS